MVTNAVSGRGKLATLAAGGVGASMTVGLLAFLALFGGVTPTSAAAQDVTCGAAGVGQDCGSLTLDEDQRPNAAMIVAVGRSMGVQTRGLVIAIATALQESGLRNLAGGDRDSAGLFQQRPSQDWGTYAQVTDPTYASQMFYSRLLAVPAWEQMALWQAAQRVQRSGFPLAYARHENHAAASVVSLAPTSNASPSTSVSSEPAAGLCGTPNLSTVVTGPVTTPIAAGSYRLSAGFVTDGSLWSSGRHTGVDFAAAEGTPIQAVAAGVVIFARSDGRYGNLTRIRHAPGLETWYAHQSAFAVNAGATVRPGQVIGAVGSTGNSTGPHTSTSRSGSTASRSTPQPGSSSAE